MSKKNHYKSVIKTLEELHSAYPTHNLGKHLSIALSEYGDLWALTDKEMLFALQKYQAELELDSNTLAQDDFVDQIVKDGMDLKPNMKWEGDDENEEDKWEE